MQEQDLDQQKLELTSSQVSERRKRFGLNVLPEQKGRTPLNIYLSQIRSPLIYIVLIAGAISFALGEYWSRNKKSS